MPACLVEHDDTVFGEIGSCKLGKIRQGLIELVDVDFGSNRQKGPPGFWMNEAIHVQPLKTMMHGHNRPLAAFGPHPAENGFQADTMFIFRPEFDDRIRVLLLQRRHEVRERFLKAACASGWALAW